MQGEGAQARVIAFAADQLQAGLQSAAWHRHGETQRWMPAEIEWTDQRAYREHRGACGNVGQGWRQNGQGWKQKSVKLLQSLGDRCGEPGADLLGKLQLRGSRGAGHQQASLDVF